MKKIYCISGRAQHGKDTTAEILCRLLKESGKRVLVTHYADLLKFICSNLFGWNGQKDENGRHILQYVGTDVIRKVEPDFWVDFVIKMLDFFGDNWDYVIIPDSRFPNEINRLKEAGFNVEHIRVVRPNFESPLTEEQQKHPSETALDGVVPDVLLKNDGDVIELENRIKSIVRNEVGI